MRCVRRCGYVVNLLCAGPFVLIWWVAALLSRLLGCPHIHHLVASHASATEGRQLFLGMIGGSGERKGPAILSATLAYLGWYCFPVCDRYSWLPGAFVCSPAYQGHVSFTNF